MKLLKIAASALMLSTAATAVNAAQFEFWYGNTGSVETAIQAACDAFNASQEEHTANCIGQGGYEAGMQKAIAAYRSGKHPVLIQFFDAGTLDLMLSDAVVPVQDIMPDVNWGDYLTGARSYYETSAGELFSQPYNGSTLIFYANMEQLGEVGVTEVPATYEAMVEAARKLKEAGHECPVTTDAHPWRVLEQFSARHGAPIASNNNGYGGLDAEYIFNEGPVADHLNNLAQWREEGLLKLNQDTKAGKYNVAFNQGECAMMEASTGSYRSAFEALGDKVEIAMAPMYEGVERRNTLIGGASLWVMKGHEGEKLEAAKAFLNYLRQDDVQIEFTRMTGYMPVTQSALTKLKESGKADMKEFATAEMGVSSLNQPGDANSRGLRLGFYVQFRDIFMEETQKAFNGGQTMQAALDAAKARGDALLRRFEQTYRGVELP
ncbi:extracellular solute-binding protein [Pseudovibrio sp. SPO723]|uniref:extracellular solute-binding protein n=1 Tax=Nesiotobacter zosterae TaxID=392721 RepID=UPI0029C527EC|nr:extracellular solute-binding protein [Pseudovibrio sp. SPO723]MDX5593501.1 extracellular solute-binding protein [Pseudovibrio sp. SPO723]